MVYSFLCTILATVLLSDYFDYVLGQQSPCPSTFQYRVDQNNLVHGLIGVISLDPYMLNLEVQLSVGNEIKNEFNGLIELLTPKIQATENLQYSKPLTYKVIFPMWEVVPPYVTAITVNGNIVCNGPPVSGSWLRFITNVTLRHTFTIQDNNVGHNQEIADINLLPGENLYTFQTVPYFLLPKTTTNFPYSNFGYNKSGQKQKFPANPSRVSTNQVYFYPYNFGYERPTTKRPIYPNRFNKFDILYNNQTTSTTPRPFVFTTQRPTSITSTTTRIQPVPSQDETCGVPDGINTLIVKGETVTRGAYPWLTAIFYRNNYTCSGSLISHKHVITAAHCLYFRERKIRASNLLFIFGRVDVEILETVEGAYNIRGEQTYIHHDYKPRHSDADIALVALAGRVPFTQFIKPVCLWSEDSNLSKIVGHIGVVAGWGLNEDGWSDLKEAREVEIPVVSQEVCKASDEVFRQVTSNRTFCAGSRDGRGPCNGDSGSGFVMLRNTKWYLRGVVSIAKDNLFANLKCDLTHYVVFTDVSKHLSWLTNIINN